MKSPRGFLLAAAILLQALLSLGCQNSELETPFDNPLYVDPAQHDFSENRALLERVLSSPHGYYRFINIPFGREVCRRFETSLTNAPSVNLHGDAHLEQYAVTDLGRGLTDFDDAATGPGIIDWMRFGVSIQLACRQLGWEAAADSLFSVFLAGYRDALNGQTEQVKEPKLAAQIRSGFSSDRSGYLKWTDDTMEAMPDETSTGLLNAMQPYVETQIAEEPGLTADYFEAVKSGILRMGIGSALDLKYLVRIQGPSQDPLDDVVLEIKEVRDLSGVDCIETGQKVNPFRILVGQARIAYQPFKHLGHFSFRGKRFWVHSWVENYEEIEIQKTLRSRRLLAEIAYDVGIQLGRGHVKHIASPLDLQIKREQQQLLQQYEADIITACHEMAAEALLAWQHFSTQFNEF